MNIRSKVLLLVSAVFVLAVLLFGLYAQQMIHGINAMWAERYVREQVLFDKHRTLLPILNEIAQVRKMAEDPAILAMALHESDPEVHNKGIEALEKYRTRFQDRSYFAAFVQSGNYYFNDADNRYEGQQLRYQLSPNKKDDQWFFGILNRSDDYIINVNKDTELGVIKVWVDYILRDQGKPVAIIGTGFDFKQFLDESVGVSQEGVKVIYLNQDFAIQLAKDTEHVDFASFTKASGDRKSLELYLSQPKELTQVKSQLVSLVTMSDQIRSQWVTSDGERQLLGMAALPEIGWYSLTFMDGRALTLINSYELVAVVVLLFVLSLLIIALMLNRTLLKPISILVESMHQIESGDKDVIVPRLPSGELGQLSQAYASLVHAVRLHEHTLAQLVDQRTAELKENEQKLSIILNSVDAFIYIKDLDYRYTYANQKVCDYFGRSLVDVIGQDDTEFFDAETAKVLRDNDRQVIEQGQKVSKEEINTDSKGRVTTAFMSVKLPLMNEEGLIYALCGISTDISLQKRQEAVIREMAFHDALTGLPNRRLLNDRLLQAFALGDRTRSHAALLLMDLDNFKPLNDSKGHHVGDLLLVELASRLKGCVRDADTVARLGGDEFVVILLSLSASVDEAQQEALKVAELIRQAVDRPFELTDEQGVYYEHHSGLSIGVSLFLGHEKPLEVLLHEADTAMYQAKSLGRNQVVLFSSSS